MSEKEPVHPTRLISDPVEAVEYLKKIYEANTAYLRAAFDSFSGEDAHVTRRISGRYPFIRITTEDITQLDTRLSYGFVSGPGTYQTTVTRPDLFANYYVEQLRRLTINHGVSFEIGVSNELIPVHFAYKNGVYLEGGLDQMHLRAMRTVFDVPDLRSMDDSIVNGTYADSGDDVRPLALFTGPRVDYSLHRLRHYTATSPENFQNYVLFTNYQFYIDEFVELGHQLMSATNDPDERAYRSQYSSFVEPGNVTTWNANIEVRTSEGMAPSRLPQMPAYHLVRSDGSGITMVNIGVGPSNAKTITDHIAVLRPHAWIMLGHCAGLRNSQRLGDYVLAHGYVREDHVLDADLPLWVPVPPLAEVQVAIENAVAEVTQLGDYELKRVMRTGTVMTVDNRNWELCDHREPVQRMSQSRAIGLDMESATIAANGFRFRVPYGTLLCVSDKPLHGELKLPGMADRFYRERVDQHLKIGIKTMELLRDSGLDRLHSRKLRCFNEVAFQ
ncbi:AMP nucleosidase [Candidatus Pandoraea novymonadis]|uniref:AMP nucleosidase n=1 Tax=Candidatus Pandoraea novymonadis TaxID=1808959 RepID=A0ABX5FEK2_9BURK|nr:AMP nucleosidase [Candidatus Pandoraea novymonadis]PSB92136.1 AMP nucleosidase [Candidatus Pandoraea novymonadis]